MKKRGPNLQNITTSSKLVQEVRKMFGRDVISTADYSQVERELVKHETEERKKLFGKVES